MIELTFLKKLKLIKQVHEKSDICHYWYFLSKEFKIQPHTCNRCHNLLIMSLNLKDTAILKMKNADYQQRNSNPQPLSS